jgi:hypothetical protein
MGTKTNKKYRPSTIVNSKEYISLDLDTLRHVDNGGMFARGLIKIERTIIYRKDMDSYKAACFIIGYINTSAHYCINLNDEEELPGLYEAGTILSYTANCNDIMTEVANTLINYYSNPSRHNLLGTMIDFHKGVTDGSNKHFNKEIELNSIW